VPAGISNRRVDVEAVGDAEKFFGRGQALEDAPAVEQANEGDAHVCGELPDVGLVDAVGTCLRGRLMFPCQSGLGINPPNPA